MAPRARRKSTTPASSEPPPPVAPATISPWRAALPVDLTLLSFVAALLLWFGARERHLESLTGALRPKPAGDDIMAVAGSPGLPGAPTPAVPPPDLTPPPPLPPRWTSKTHASFTGERIADEDRLVGFYQALTRVAFKEAGAKLRIVQFGDSITANDAVTSRARERLQQSFGDGGAGFIYMVPASRHYRHLSVLQKASAGWKIRSIVGAGVPDHLYGLGGASFEGGGEVSIATRKEAPGESVGSFDLYYLKQPRGGSFELVVDGEVKATVDTTAAAVSSGFERVEVAEGAHKLTVRARGAARGYGVVLERPGVGVTYDNLGLVSGSAKALLQLPEEHWKQQLEHRGVNLAVVYLGANEADYTPPGKAAMAEYETRYGAMLSKLRAALPAQASCLVFSITDAANVVDGKVSTKPAVPGLVEAQRRAASASGCAFWDAFKWMGGQGSVLKWRRRNEWEPDLTHPNRIGAAKLADGLIDALLAGFDAYREQHP